MFHKPPNNVLVQLRSNLELLNHMKRQSLKGSIPIYTYSTYIYIYIHIYIYIYTCHFKLNVSRLISTPSKRRRLQAGADTAASTDDGALNSGQRGHHLVERS